jgi:threonine/homoserine/homoserine lactone efflux protein
MEWMPLVAGIAVGLAISMPIGAVNLLVIRTALRNGFRAALLTGLGAVAADLLMASVVLLGIASIAGFMARYAAILQIGGGVLLVIIGIRTAQRHFSEADLESQSYAAKFGLTFWLCVSNPAIYFGYVAILGGVTQALEVRAASVGSLLIALGVATGSFLWWAFLGYVVSRLGRKLKPRILDRINHWSGIIVAALGFVLLSEAWPALTAWFAR